MAEIKTYPLTVELSIKELMALYAAIHVDDDAYSNSYDIYRSDQDQVLIKVKKSAHETIEKACLDAS